MNSFSDINASNTSNVQESILVNLAGAKSFRNLSHTGKRVSKIRWLGSGSTLTLPNYNATEYFVTGSWGEEADNEICLWKLSIDRIEQDQRIPQIDKICPFPVIGNVTDIVSLGDDKFAFTTSKGVLAIFKVMDDCDEQGFSAASAIHPASASQLHTFKKTKLQCPATGIATNNDDSLVTVGEDGSIYEVSLSTSGLVQSFESVDPLSITTVEFIGRQEIITGNMGGQVKLYDLRANNKSALRTLYDLNELSGVKSLAQHPTQSHMLLIGYESGQMELQDLRQNSTMIGSGCEPIAYLPHQNSGIGEIYFHPVNPDNFFTASQNGELVHWVPGEPTDENLAQHNGSVAELNLEFLNYGFTSTNLYSSPFPLNSLSLSRHNRLICGGDSGFVFCTDLIQL